MKNVLWIVCLLGLAAVLSGCPEAPPAPQVSASPDTDACGRVSIIANAPRGAVGQFELYKNELLIGTTTGAEGKEVQMEQVIPKDAKKHHGYHYYRHFYEGNWRYYQLVGTHYFPVDVAYIGPHTVNPVVTATVLLFVGLWLLNNGDGNLNFDFGIGNDDVGTNNKVPYAVFPVTDSKEAQYKVGFIADGYSEPTYAGPWTLASNPNGCAPPVVTTYTLTIAQQGQGTVNPAPGTYTHNAGATIPLTATPASGWNFAGWQGSVTSTSGTTTVTMGGNRSVTAVFEQIPVVTTYTLTIAQQGQGTVNPAPGTYTHNAGATIPLAATPASGWNFAGWQGSVTSTSGTTTVTMGGNRSVTAVFEQIIEPSFELSYDYVPVFNDSTNTVLRGQVTSNNIEDFGPYAVGTFLFIPGVGWAGPFPGEGAQPDLNGRFAYNIVGHPLHYFATKVRTVLVQDEVEMPTCNVCTEPPLTLEALAMVESDRSSQAQPEVVLDYVPACRDESNTMLSGYVLDVAPHPNAVVAYLRLADGNWAGPFPNEGGFIEEDGYFAFNIVGHPLHLTATFVRLFVVPDWVESPTCNTCTQAPWIAENLAWTDVERDCPPEEPVNQVPTLRLNGSAAVNHPYGHPYTDPGATATDPEDGNISAFIVVTGSVNVNTPGVHVLRYNVRDSQGLAATEVTRTVTVTSAPIPVTAPTIGTVTVDPDSGEVTITFDGWTEEGAALVKVELLAEINFADEPWLFWGLVTKPGDLAPHYFAASGPSITLTYNQDFGAPIPRDWTARRLVIRLLTANAVTQFLNTDTAITDGDPLNLPNLTSGQVLESAAVDIGTKQATLSGVAYYQN
jgi:hypothetical protein